MNLPKLLSLSVIAAALPACSAADLESEELADELSSGLTLSQPIEMRSGAWWGDVSTPLVDQVWGTVLNATPNKNLTAPFTFQWKCELPVFPPSSQTLKLTTGSFSVDSTVKKSFSNPQPGQILSYTLDPAQYSAGWIEVRIRCKATETTGPDAGKVTAITAGFPLQIKGGTSEGETHSLTNYVDTHGWYDRGVGYVYATILNISDVMAAPLHGVVQLQLRARTSGDTTLDHFMLKIDGQVATLSDGQLAEFHGATKDRTVSIDTTKLSNGAHVLAMHAHGLEDSDSEQPGKQLAAQVEVTVQVQN